MSTALLQRTPRAGTSRILSAAFVGTTIEYYDFYLYATASALVFGPEFFPKIDSNLGLLASFATYGVGFVARPIGGIVGGHLGDRIGRKRLLVISLLVMGIASTLIGVLPTYALWGTWAVVGLVVLRLIQGLASGAEWGGSAVLSVEHAPAKWRGFFGSFTQAGSAAGMLLATGALTLAQVSLGSQAFLAWGWRIPFLLSALIVVVGLIIRLKITDSPEFVDLVSSGGAQKYPVLQALKRALKQILVTAGLRLAQPALYSILTTYILTYLLQVRGDSRAGLQGVLIVSALSVITTPLWGYLSDRWGRRRILLVSTLAIGVFIWPFFAFLTYGPLAILWIVMFIGMNLLHDSIYGPQAAAFAELFPPDIRYSGVSLGYQIGSIVSVGITPLLAVWLFSISGSRPWLICALISFYAILSWIAALYAKPVGESSRGPKPDSEQPGSRGPQGQLPEPELEAEREPQPEPEAGSGQVSSAWAEAN